MYRFWGKIGIMPRLTRLSRLLVAIGGLIGLAMQIAPKDGISNFCEWLSGFGPHCPSWFTWDQLQPYLPIASGALVVSGIVWFFWPQAKLGAREHALRLREIEAQEATAAATQRHAEALERQYKSPVLENMIEFYGRKRDIGTACPYYLYDARTHQTKCKNLLWD